MSVDLKQDIPDGYKQTEVGVIPEDWIVKPLEYFTSFISYGFTNPMPTVYDGPAMITARDINRGKILYSSARSTSVEAYENFLSSKSKPKINDLLLTKDGTLGRLALVDRENICINQSVALLRPNSQITPSYFKLLLESPFYQDKMLDDAGGSTIKHIYITIVNRMLLGLPPTLIEQTAIANALSDVDALLSELEILIVKKQAIKTATMQQLLTGKTRLPQFAFYSDINSTEGAVEGKRNNASATNVNVGAMDSRRKGTKTSELGEIPEDWDVSTIADISLVPMQNGLFYEPARKGKGVPLINVSDMYTSAPISVESLELFNASKTELKVFKVNEGDLFFTRSSIVPSGIAFCNVLPKTDKEVVFDSHLIRVRVNPKIADYNYVYLNCLAKHSRLHLIANSKTATMTTIDQKAINCCPVLLPCKEEQTAIATILSDMDNEIQTLEQRLSKTRQIKQGMMQELLTGKTRLPFDKDTTSEVSV
jgi:type I restriction enzyme S subunit